MGRKITILLILSLTINLLAFYLFSWTWAAYTLGKRLIPSEIAGWTVTLLELVLIFIIGRFNVLYFRKRFGSSPASLFTMGAFIFTTGYLLEPGSMLYVRLLFVVLFAVLAGAYYFFPVIAHRSLNPTLGQFHFWISMVCGYLLCIPRSFLHYPASIDVLQFILLAAQSLFLINVLNSSQRSEA